MFKLVLSLLVIFSSMAMATQAESDPAHFVLVHGALFTAQGWDPVRKELPHHGYNATASDLPGRNGDPTPASEINLMTAAEKVCEVLRKESRPAILVGHSQGGAVITQAVASCAPLIKALVYIAAVVPKNGELPFDRLSPEDNAIFDQCATYDDLAKLYRVNSKGPLWEAFMGDLPESEARYWTKTLVSEPSEIGNTRLQYPTSVFDSIPKYYVETQKDRIISPATQKEIQKGMSFVKTYSLNSSHSPFLSQPGQLVEILVDVQRNLERP